MLLFLADYWFVLLLVTLSAFALNATVLMKRHGEPKLAFHIILGVLTVAAGWMFAIGLLVALFREVKAI